MEKELSDKGTGIPEAYSLHFEQAKRIEQEQVMLLIDAVYNMINWDDMNEDFSVCCDRSKEMIYSFFKK